MFRASSAHLQEDTVVYMKHMVLSLSMRVPGGLSVHSLSSHSNLFMLRVMNWRIQIIQGGSNMTETDLYVNKPHCAAAVRP